MNLNDFPYKIGNRFYLVQPQHGYDNRKTFTAPCPACGNTKKIKFMGVDGKEYTGRCPNCDTSYRADYGNVETVVNITNYEVAEYIINKLVIGTLKETKGAFKKQVPDEDIKLKEVEGFYKWARDIDHIDFHQFNPYSSRVIKSGDNKALTNLLQRKASGFGDSKSVVFLDKKDAEVVRQYMVDTDIGRIEKFNARFGTDFEYPWKG